MAMVIQVILFECTPDLWHYGRLLYHLGGPGYRASFPFFIQCFFYREFFKFLEIKFCFSIVRYDIIDKIGRRQLYEDINH